MKKLICSNGHVYNLEDFRYKHFKVGDKCPMSMSYDLLARPKETFCRRKLYDFEEYNKRPSNRRQKLNP